MPKSPSFFISNNSAQISAKHQLKLIESSLHTIQANDFKTEEWFVINQLRQKGHKVFVWGGKIRDNLLRPKKPSRDMDLLTTANSAEIQKIFKDSCTQFSGSINSITVSVNTNGQSCFIDINSLDPALYTNNDYMTAVAQFINNSDFTCNTFILDIDSWKLIYHYKHMELFHRGIMQTVGFDPVTSLASDPTRILRGIRIAYETNLHFGHITTQAIANCKKYIKNLDDAQFNKHLDLLISSCGINGALNLINRYQLASYLIRPAKTNISHFSLNPSAQTLFIEALYADDFKHFKALLATHRHLINNKDEEGNTAAHIMVIFNREKYLRHLIASGANMHIRNNQGISPLQLTQPLHTINNQLYFTHKTCFPSA